MAEQRCSVPRGKGLGGSTIINGAVYVRGNKDDYDSWSNAGNDGWSYEEVLPYLKKSENSQIDGDPTYHGKGGLLNIENPIPLNTVAKAFIDANLEIGHKLVDYNGKSQLGVSRPQFKTIHGRRLSTGKAFLAYARRRENLQVLTYSYARKVLINSNNTAYGVVFDYEGITNIVRATKEIIISAGTIGSPHLLMLSGIGPSKVLAPLGIQTISNLPVGENLQDHVTVSPFTFITNYSESAKTLQEDSRDFLNGFGALSFFYDTHALVFFKTASSTCPSTVPDILVTMALPSSLTNYQQQTLNFKDETYNGLYSGINTTKSFVIYPELLHPKSKGRITLQSSNPYEYPNIDFNSFSDNANKDIKILYEGIKIMMRLKDTAPFKKIDVQLQYPMLPQCSNYTNLSKQQWYCNIQHLAFSGYHPIGTCKMAPRDQGGVVNNQLKVYGIDKLRVADASIFPSITSGPTATAAIMVGEKLADMLKSELNEASALAK